MLDWWNLLPLEYQIFYGIGIISTIILVFQLILSLVGAGDHADFAGGGDAGFDGGVDIAHSTGLHIISVRTVIAFLAGFGWSGAVALRQGLGMPLAILVAVLVGVTLMLLIVFLMRMLYGMRHSGSLDYRNAIGLVGTVYIRIPPERRGEGQVKIMVQGRLGMVSASTDAKTAIPGGSQVRVVELVTPRTVLVQEIKNAPVTPVAKEGD
jgi:hypothetical protein